MNWCQLWNAVKQPVARGFQQIEAQVKQWIKPRRVKTSPARAYSSRRATEMQLATSAQRG
jgi:hypothetical protein